MTQPQLTTRRLALVPATARDLPILRHCWNHPEVRRFLFDDQEVTEILASEVLGHCLPLASGGLGMWLINAGNDVVGNAALYPVGLAGKFEPRIAPLLEPLVALTPAFQRRGYATEALNALLEHGFGRLGQTVIAAVNDAPNVASARMLQRAGFESLAEVEGPAGRLCTYVQTAGAWKTRQSGLRP